MVQKRNKRIQTNQMWACVRMLVCLFLFWVYNKHDFGWMRCWSFTRLGKCTTIEIKHSKLHSYRNTTYSRKRALIRSLTDTHTRADARPCIKSTIWILCLLIKLPLNQSIYLSDPTKTHTYLCLSTYTYLFIYLSNAEYVVL